MNNGTVLVVDGHPNEESLGRALADAYAKGAEGAGARVERLALRALSFDLVLRGGHEREQPLEPDLLRAKEAIERAAHVAWLFPCWWAGPPALLKGFIDRLFLPGWAYKYERGQALPKALLAGRSARQIVTMDSPGWWYTLAYHRAIHGSFATGTLSFVGFSPVKTRTIYRVRELDQRALASVLAAVEGDGAKDARRSVPLLRESGPPARIGGSR